MEPTYRPTYFKDIAANYWLWFGTSATATTIVYLAFGSASAAQESAAILGVRFLYKACSRRLWSVAVLFDICVVYAVPGFAISRLGAGWLGLVAFLVTAAAFLTAQWLFKLPRRSGLVVAISFLIVGNGLTWSVPVLVRNALPGMATTFSFAMLWGASYIPFSVWAKQAWLTHMGRKRGQG